MKNYLHSAIDTIYRKDDELIIIGLTGRTGSGCSTVANILCSEKQDIRHSLAESKSPENIDQRKQKIIFKHFDLTWQKFQLIQVRSVITLFLIDASVDLIWGKLIKLLAGEDIDFKNLNKKLDELKIEFDRINAKNCAQETIIFYTTTLPKICAELKIILGERAFVKLYQEIGKNIRISGLPLDSELVEGKFFTLAERINSIIKLIVNSNKKIGKSTLIVVDAIRSPLEAIFFQDRYAAFYLAAVACPDNQRKQRLHRMEFSDDDVQRIDQEEYRARDLNKTATYSVQDIQACIQRADIYISNPDEQNQVSQFQNLSNQIIRFISLMKRPGIITPTPIELCI